MGRDQPLAVADQEIFGNGVDAIIKAAGVLNLLRTERHENGTALGRERPQSMDAAQAIRENSIQTVLLLIAENRKAA